MGSGIKDYYEELEQEAKEERKKDLERYREEVIKKIEDIDITGSQYGDQEFKDFLWLWRNRNKIIANKELLNLIKSWKE